jgi:hypothetical protein
MKSLRPTGLTRIPFAGRHRLRESRLTAAGVIAAAALTGASFACQRWRFADFDASEPHDDD